MSFENFDLVAFMRAFLLGILFTLLLDRLIARFRKLPLAVFCIAGSITTILATIFLYNAWPSLVNVPDLNGFLQADAIAALESKSLIAKAETIYDSNAKIGSVIPQSQIPSAGEKVRKGSLVVFKITGQKTISETNLPSIEGKTSEKQPKSEQEGQTNSPPDTVVKDQIQDLQDQSFIHKKGGSTASDKNSNSENENRRLREEKTREEMDRIRKDLEENPTPVESKKPDLTGEHQGAGNEPVNSENQVIHNPENEPQTDLSHESETTVESGEEPNAQNNMEENLPEDQEAGLGSENEGIENGYQEGSETGGQWDEEQNEELPEGELLPEGQTEENYSDEGQEYSEEE